MSKITNFSLKIYWDDQKEASCPVKIKDEACFKYYDANLWPAFIVNNIHSNGSELNSFVQI